MEYVVWEDAGQVYGNWASLLGYLPARLTDAGLERAQQWEAVRARYGLNGEREGRVSIIFKYSV